MDFKLWIENNFHTYGYWISKDKIISIGSHFHENYVLDNYKEFGIPDEVMDGVYDFPARRAELFKKYIYQSWIRVRFFGNHVSVEMPVMSDFWLRVAQKHLISMVDDSNIVDIGIFNNPENMISTTGYNFKHYDKINFLKYS